MLLRNKLFLISTAIFLIGALLLIWKGFPGLLEQYHTQADQSASLDSDIKKQQDYVNLLNTLQQQRSTVDSLYATAQKALPTNSQNELLLLEVDGLLKDVGLENLTVTSASSSSSSAASSSDSVKAGSVGSSTPVIKSTEANSGSISLAGDMDFGQLQTLISRLKSFSRWNKVASIDISQANNGNLTVTLVFNVYSDPNAPKTFAGTDSNFLTSAQKVFGSLRSYSTTPDYTKEGNFGRDNPFASLH